MEEKTKITYIAPTTEALHLDSESVICSSGEEMTPGNGSW